MINAERAMEKSKEFLEKIKGLDLELGGRKLIDWLNFEAENDEETNSDYTIICKFQENLFNPNRVTFRILVNKETGDIDDFKRVYEE